MVGRYYGKVFAGYASITAFLLFADGSLARVFQFPGGICARLFEIYNDRTLVGISVAFFAIAMLVPAFTSKRILPLLGWIVLAILISSVVVAYSGALAQGP